MAIIYTYPSGPSPLTGEELIVISDPNNSNSTRNTTAQAIADLNDFEITLDASSTGLSFSPSLLEPGTYTVNLSGIVNTSSGGTGLGTIGSANQVLTSNGSDLFYQTGIDGPVLFDAQADEALVKGDVVYISGFASGPGLATVSKADASDPAKMPAYGLALQAANVNDTIQIVTFGDITGLNTSSFSAGAALYVDTTPGALTDFPPPTEANLIQNIGKVERSAGGTNGIIKVGGAGRTNATPNLNEGSIFVGNSLNRSSVLAIGNPGEVLTVDVDPITSNPFASWSAIPSSTEDLATTLAAGNFTGGNDMVMSTQTGTRIIRSDNTVASQQAAICFINQPTTVDGIKIGDPNGLDGGLIGTSSNGGYVEYHTGPLPTDAYIFSANAGGFQFLQTGATSPASIKIGTNLDLQFVRGFTTTIDAPTITANQTIDFPDQSGVIPVTAAPGATEDGYVLTWDDTNSEYKFLAAGAGLNGIYTGSGSLTSSTTVTMGANDLTFTATTGDILFNNNVFPNPTLLIDGSTNTIGMGGNATLVEQLSIYNQTGSGNTTALGIYGINNTGSQVGMTIGVTAAATTNTALKISALGATSNNYAILTTDGQSGFGTTTPDPSAIVDVSSTTQAFYPPRMTTAEMNAIAGGSPNEGAILFDITTKQFMGYNGTSWVILG